MVSRHLARNLFLAGELRLVARALDEAAIPYLVLKGLPLLREAYGNIAARQCTDIDVLVSREHVHAAASLLGALGYRGHETLTLESELRNNFEYTFRRRTRGEVGIVDLHWRALSDVRHCGDDAAVWEKTRDVEFEGQTVHVPSREFALLHLAAHYQQHSFSVPRILRDLAAAYHAWSPELDHHHFTSLAKRLGVCAAWDWAVYVAQTHAGLGVAAPTFGSRRARWWASRLDVASLAQPREYPLYRHMLVAASLGDLRVVPRYLARNLLPSTERLAATQGPDAAASLPLRYVTRLANPFRRAFDPDSTTRLGANRPSRSGDNR